MRMTLSQYVPRLQLCVNCCHCAMLQAYFAGEYDMKFNAQKSKLLVCLPRSRQKQTADSITSCQVFIGGKVIERVDSFLHLGHVITSSQNDKEDIMYRRNCFINQANNVLCFFSKLSGCVRTKLFKAQAYCNSRYGCELWSLDNACIKEFDVAWRKAVRRVLKIPADTHSYLLPLLMDMLPFTDDIHKRSASFVTACLV